MVIRRRLGAVAIGLAVVVVAIAAAAFVAGRDDDSAATEPGEAPPLDLAVVGDSFAEQSRDAIMAMAGDRGLEVSVDAFGGSALCGWMGRLEELARTPPRRLVLSFAGNILQPCVNPSCETECQDVDPVENADRYRQDLEEVLALFEDTPTEIYVVTPPPTAMPDLEQYAAAMRDMYRTAGQEHPELHVIDSATRLDPDSQGFQATLPCLPDEDCPPEGEIAVRQDDGAHFTPAGGRRYALAIFDALRL